MPNETSYWRQPARGRSGNVRIAAGFKGKTTEKLWAVCIVPVFFLPFALIMSASSSIWIGLAAVAILAGRSVYYLYFTNKWWTEQERTRLYGERPPGQD